MKTVYIEKFGKPISFLGLGAMRLPQQGNVICQEQVDTMVDYALEKGINYFDTAYVYGGGASEIALGKALGKHPRDSYFIADKLPLGGLKDSQHMDELFQTSLDRLQMDSIDFYLMHAVDSQRLETMKQVNAVAWAKKKKEEGKIRYLGFSIHDNDEVLWETLSLADWDFVQIQYNYMDILDNPGEKGYEELRRRGIPILIMEPLKGGLLADIPDHLAKPFLAIGGSNVSYSFRWLAEKEGILTVLSGMSNLSQLEQNVEIFGALTPLSQEEHAAIAEVKSNLESAQKVGCTGCGYCMPCPLGVEIPQLFHAWNTRALYQGTNWISGGDIEYDNAAQCIGCGACLSLCPQHIAIPKYITQIIKERQG